MCSGIETPGTFSLCPVSRYSFKFSDTELYASTKNINLNIPRENKKIRKLTSTATLNVTLNNCLVLVLQQVIV